MPDVWLPGAWRDYGACANYQGGWNRLELAVSHFTVGADSRGIGRRGYFHWLVHQDAGRENGCTQYAPINAATWHAGGSSSMPDANQRGPGIEFERRVTGGYNDDGLANAEPLTDNQIVWGQRIVDFCAEWGIAPVMYDGPRYGAGGWRGWVNHHDLDRDRYDGLTNGEWAAIIGGTTQPDPTKQRNGDSVLYVIGSVIEDGRPDAGQVLTVLYDTVSGVECARLNEPSGAFGFGGVASSWIQQGALAYFTSPLGAYVVGMNMQKLRQAHGYQE
jgi:hypothetical protein